MGKKIRTQKWGRMLSQCPRCGELAAGKNHIIQLRKEGWLKKSGEAGASSAKVIHSWYDSTGVHRYKKTCYLGPWDSQWDPLVIQMRAKRAIRKGEIVTLKDVVSREPCSNAFAHQNAQPAAVRCTHCDLVFCQVCATNHLRGRDGRLVSI